MLDVLDCGDPVLVENRKALYRGLRFPQGLSSSNELRHFSADRDDLREMIWTRSGLRVDFAGRRQHLRDDLPNLVLRGAVIDEAGPERELAAYGRRSTR